MADTPQHKRTDRLIIAKLSGTMVAERLSDEEKTAELQSLVADISDPDHRAHLLAHAAGRGDGPRADAILRAAGADMDEAMRIRAKVVGRSLLAGIAEGLTASTRDETGPR